MRDQEKVTKQVSAMYAECPYPAHGIVSSVVPLMIRDSLETLFSQVGSRDLRLLDAGCGTGEQTLGLARAFPELQVTGVDIVKASLDFARELGQRHRIRATFEEADLSQALPATLGSFDVIISVGVLHHFADPAAGFRNLRAVARPHGLFMGMVYGRFGRAEYYAVHEALKMISGADLSRQASLEILSESGIARNRGLWHYAETLSRRVRFGPRIRPAEALRRALAGRSAQYQADAYTHVQETAYTWDELIELLGSTGWKWAGWPRKSGIPDGPEQLFRGRALDLVRRLDRRRQAAIYERLVSPGNLYFLAYPATAAPELL